MVMRSRVLVSLALVIFVSACSDRDTAEATATTETTTTLEEPADTTQPPSAVAPHDCVGELDGPETHRYRDDVGDEIPELVSLDVYRRPEASGCPVLIWVHGGGWTVGDKAGKAIDTKVDFAGELGVALVSVNYRLVTPDGDIRWPVMGQDTASAVSWVIDHAEDLGIDPSRVALMGHSAGAHLASIVATDPALLEASGGSREQVRCVVALDTAAYEITPAEARGRPLFSGTFGSDPDTLAAASPTTQAREHPSGLPDFLVVTRGSNIRTAESGTFVETIDAGGAEAVLVDAGDYTHEQVNENLGLPTEDIITPPTRAFLQSCFE